MRVLVDECCDDALVAELREAGHDVYSMSESNPSAPDTVVIETARSQDRVLITEDKDFGDLVFRQGSITAGVVFLRDVAVARSTICRNLLDFLRCPQEGIAGRFFVMEPGRTPRERTDGS